MNNNKSMEVTKEIIKEIKQMIKMQDNVDIKENLFYYDEVHNEIYLYMGNETKITLEILLKILNYKNAKIFSGTLFSYVQENAVSMRVETYVKMSNDITHNVINDIMKIGTDSIGSGCENGINLLVYKKRAFNVRDNACYDEKYNKIGLDIREQSKIKLDTIQKILCYENKDLFSGTFFSFAQNNGICFDFHY